jgi:tetratricopeptide (TPR) repeat protein
MRALFECDISGVTPTGKYFESTRLPQLSGRSEKNTNYRWKKAGIYRALRLSSRRLEPHENVAGRLLADVVRMSTIGLSMIVKNEAESLRQCLLSVQAVVDEIVIGDTGSTDGTPDIARECGATVIPVPWENHFGNARNAALAALRTDWVLSLDADEELDREAVRALPVLVARSKAAGYILPVRNYSPAECVRAGNSLSQPNDGSHPRAASARSFFIYEKCRLFQKRPEICFTGRIHEQVEVTARRSGLQLSHTDLVIHNFGLLMQRGDMQEKIVRYRDLLRLRVAEEPDDFRGWTYLGRMEYDSFNNRNEALQCFQRALGLNPGCVEALLFTAMICLDLGQSEAAKKFLQFKAPDAEGEKRRLQLLGDSSFMSGDLPAAKRAYCDALAFNSADADLDSRLGLVEVKLGEGRGIERLRRAAACSKRVEVHDRLMKGYLAAGMISSAAEAAESLAELNPQPKTFLRAASIRAHLAQWSESRRLLQRGMELFPQSEELRVAHSEAERSSVAKAP